MVRSPAPDRMGVSPRPCFLVVTSMSAATPDSETPSSGEPPRQRLRGLWDVMGQPVDALPDGVAGVESDVVAEGVAAEIAGENAPSQPGVEDAPAEETRPAGKSLWSVMGSPVSTPAPDPIPAAPAAASPSELDFGDYDDYEDDDEIVPEPAAVVPEDVQAAPSAVPVSLTEASVSATTRKSGSPDRWSLVLGVSAVPFAALAYFPSTLWSLPSAACSFAALWLTLLVWTKSRVNRREQCQSAVGGLAAVLALMTGPLVFAPLGNAVRDHQSIGVTQLHLEEIGRGLQQHHQEHGTYPIGGTRMTDASGKRRGGHGWMTRLLPFIGQTVVYNEIELEQPYDAPVNRPALGTPIETYYAAQGDRSPVANGFAVAHFAGVGGKVRTTRGEELGAGIFGLGNPFREQDLRDGLSNTWIVGEIPGGYPPWGDPENWRTVKKGINRDSEGFGNAAGTGAMCLFADGSVRFLGNRTDVDLLRRYSTRDGNDLGQ